MITEHLRINGFEVGFSRHPFPYGTHRWPLHLARKDEIGVVFRWLKCDGTDSKLCEAIRATCPLEEHVHLSASIRTGAGGVYGAFGILFVPVSVTTLDAYRGAPPQRTQISRYTLPEPYRFRTDRYLANGDRYYRIGAISSARLANVVGIQDSAKIDPDMVGKPDEPVWFHFDCLGYAGATFDIITDGEVWYPINRTSRRITTQMKPKKSVDLTNMSVNDQEFLLAAIQDFAAKM
jgi:hypothetical protein